MKEIKNIIEAAQQSGQGALSEYESKQVLSAYGIPVVEEVLVSDLEEAKKGASRIGYPVVLKVCAPEITHKTESGMIAVDLRREEDLEQAFNDLKEKARGAKGGFLLQQMIKGARELVIGLIRDPQFGPCVMFGLGGIFTEILRDVTFRVAPIEKRDAMEMMQEIKGHKILDAIRGMEAVDTETLSQSLIALGNIGLEHDAIQEIDVNPMIVHGNSPVAVDALVVLRDMKEKEGEKTEA